MSNKCKLYMDRGKFLQWTERATVCMYDQDYLNGWTKLQQIES